MTDNLFNHLADSIPDPDKTVIQTAQGEHYSYGDLIALTGRLANVLVARGVKPDDRVAVQVEKSVPALALYLACLRAGAVYLPLNTAYTLTELEYFIGDAEPALIVCDSVKRGGVAKIAAAFGAAVDTLDANGSGSLTDLAAAQPDAFDTIRREPDDLAAILYTSGTTGRSKGAMITHQKSCLERAHAHRLLALHQG